MLITADQLVCHTVGDYLLQSDWMAERKSRYALIALVHAVAYALPFLLLQPSIWAMLFIVGTHAVIDHLRLARYVVFAKNFLAPRWAWHPWMRCQATGYHIDRPAWLTTWLFIIADNTLHVICNGLALRYL